MCWIRRKEKIACDNEQISREWIHFGFATRFHTGLATSSLFKFLLTHLISFFFSKQQTVQNGTSLVIISWWYVLMRLRLSVQVQDFVYRFAVLLLVDYLCIYTFHWPSQQTLRMSMNQVFRNVYPRTRCINYSLEIFTEQSSAYQARDKPYPNDKNKIVQVSFWYHTLYVTFLLQLILAYFCQH